LSIDRELAMILRDMERTPRRGKGIFRTDKDIS